MARKYIDETGHTYGRLTVIEPIYINGKLNWRCQCSCGNEHITTGSNLRRGDTQSCGCLQRERARQSCRQRNVENGKSINIGDKFGHLTILNEAEYILENNGKNQRYYQCRCDCGNLVRISGNHLLTDHTTTCGCKTGFIPPNFIDETNNKYGLLTVLEYVGVNEERKALWKCRCECGNLTITMGKSLRAGFTNSCGCLSSKGEAKIAELLRQMNIPYI